MDRTSSSARTGHSVISTPRASATALAIAAGPGTADPAGMFVRYFVEVPLAAAQVEGELRSREYESKKTDSKQRVWEIRVASILKLDRAEKAAPEDQDHDEVPQEETAA